MVAHFVTHDPATDWNRLKVPVLALYGERDVQVSVTLNAPALAAALAGKDDVTIETVEAANHLFQRATTGSTEEYATLPPEFVEGLSRKIAAWINAR